MNNSQRYLLMGLLASIIIWMGSTWSVGYLVVPILFKNLDSIIAGKIAGQLFYVVNWIDIIIPSILIGLIHKYHLDKVNRSMILFFGIPLIISFLDLFILFPYMETLKTLAGNAGVMNSTYKSTFSFWHGVSSLLYLTKSLFMVGCLQYVSLIKKLN